MVKDEKIIEKLQDFGLDSNEAGVYLASLSLGSTTILKLSQQSGINRTTVYEVVGALEKKGLMKKEIKGLKTVYAPEPPERLEKTLEAKKANLMELLPELQGKYHLKGKGSSIKYYEGLTAIKNVYDELLQELRPHDFYYVI